MTKITKLFSLSRSFGALTGYRLQNTVLSGLGRHTQRQGEWRGNVLYLRSSSLANYVQPASRARCFVGELRDCLAQPFSNGYFSHSLHTSTACNSHIFESFRILETWNNVVHPFGKLIVQGSFNVHLESLNPFEHPEMDKAFVRIYGRKENGEELKQSGDTHACSVNVSDHGKLLHINRTHPEQQSRSEATYNQTPLECVIQVPIKFGIHVDVDENYCVNVSNLESSDVKISCNMGDCVLSNIRAGFVSVQSIGGNIRCKHNLQGNIDLKTGLDGEITGDKLQGCHIRGQTYAGQLRIQTLYGDDAILWSNTGMIHLGSCHGNTSVDVYEGKICIDSMDGDLAAHVKTSGEVDVHLSRHEKVDISVGKGDVRLKLPDTVHTGIEMEAPDIKIDPGFKHSQITEEKGITFTTVSGHLGPSDVQKDEMTSNVKVFARKGQINTECCDWFTSVKNSPSWKL